jgi:hypothetical protein
MRIAVVAQLAEGDKHLLGCRAIVAGPESLWTGAWFGTQARVYREGFHLLEGVALVVGSSPDEMAVQVAGCPYPVVLVAYSGSARRKVMHKLEAAVKARQDAGQAVHLFLLAPGFGTILEAENGACAFVGGHVPKKAEPTAEEE